VLIRHSPPSSRASPGWTLGFALGIQSVGFSKCLVRWVHLCRTYRIRLKVFSAYFITLKKIQLSMNLKLPLFCPRQRGYWAILPIPPNGGFCRQRVEFFQIRVSMVCVIGSIESQVWKEMANLTYIFWISLKSRSCGLLLCFGQCLQIHHFLLQSHYWNRVRSICVYMITFVFVFVLYLSSTHERKTSGRRERRGKW
jgi:hypothetical protein